MAPLVFMMLALATGCGQPTKSAVTNEPGPAAIAQTTTCKELLNSDWTPPARGEPEVDWDPGTGAALFTFSNDVILRLNIRTDLDCARVPILGRMVTQMLTSYEQDLLTQCKQAVELVLSGEPPRKGNVVGDLDGLREGIKAECPSSFDEQLRAAGK